MLLTMTLKPLTVLREFVLSCEALGPDRLTSEDADSSTEVK